MTIGHTMTSRLGPGDHPLFQDSDPLVGRAETVRADSRRWAEVTGGQLLVVDPASLDDSFAGELASRGIHVTHVLTTVDALIEFGRTNPRAVVVAPEAPGLAVPAFVAKVKEYSNAVIVAILESPNAAIAGPLMLAGVTGAVTRPYTATSVWDLLDETSHALDEHIRVRFGRIELDARAYTVTVDGLRIPDLPLKEFELLRLLMYRAPEVVSDEELRASLWGRNGKQPTDNTIAVHAARVRNRLRGIAKVRRLRGRGYSLTLS